MGTTRLFVISTHSSINHSFILPLILPLILLLASSSHFITVLLGFLPFPFSLLRFLSLLFHFLTFHFFSLFFFFFLLFISGRDLTLFILSSFKIQLCSFPTPFLPFQHNPSLSSPSQKLNAFNATAEYNNYLIYILTQLKGENEGVRAMAGLLLKNNIRSYFDSFHPEVKEYIKNSCVAALGDPQPLVRSTIGTVITTICSRGLKNWPNLLPSLYNLLEHTDIQFVEVLPFLSFFLSVCEPQWTWW